MAELLVQGPQESERLQRSIASGETLLMGRDPGPGASACPIPWEHWLSRRHAELLCEGERLRVTQLDQARNPIYFRGEPATHFSMSYGDCFVIGQTTFRLMPGDGGPRTSDAGRILNSYTIGTDELRQVRFRDAPHRLDVLGHLSRVIFGITEASELFTQTSALLFEGLPRADVIAFVSIAPADATGSLCVLHQEYRLGSGGAFRPSERLVREALVRLKNSVVHVWSGEEVSAESAFTLQGNFDWAFCTPLRSEVCQGMGIYVAGRLSGSSPSTLMAPWQSNDLSEDVKFTELVAAIVSALRQVHTLQHRQSVLSHFFSPAVLRVLSTSTAEAELKPREAEVTVQFCDVRGFSRKVELASDKLPAILERVSAALSVMSSCILEHKGVVADFLGDCAMGFWGWPLSNPDDVQQACLAALRIRAQFELFSRQPDHPLADFKVGIGMATGHAVAGQIGSRDQAKVTVFGPVVNLASRLEGLTKLLRVPILIDEAIARVVTESMPPELARCRRLAIVKPYGLETPLTVSELLLPADRGSALTDEHLAHYDAALQAFLEGRWNDSYVELHRIPPQDLGKDFLLSYILQHNHTPPQNWDGVIAIQSKN